MQLRSHPPDPVVVELPVGVVRGAEATSLIESRLQLHGLIQRRPRRCSSGFPLPSQRTLQIHVAISVESTISYFFGWSCFWTTKKLGW